MNAPTKVQLNPLHTHTVYSVLDGASTIDEYIKWAVENGANAVGVTDHGWMIGALELYQKCKKAGIASLPGCEFYVAPDSDYVFNKKPYDYYHVTVWAVTEEGYRNLLKLGSLAWKDGDLKGMKWNKKNMRAEESDVSRVVKRFGDSKPRITFAELLEHNEGLLIGTGCLIGAVNKALLNGETKGAERNLLKLNEVYKGRMFMELMPHICDHDYNRETKSFGINECTDFSPDGDLQKACNLKNIELAKKYDIPLLMTIDSHFVKPDQKPLQDCLLQSGDPKGWHFFNSYHMMTTGQAWDHWSGRYGSDVEQQKIFTEAVENNLLIGELAADLTITDPYHLPTPEIPQEIIDVTSSPSEQNKALILRLIDSHGRMKWDDPIYEERLYREIGVICDNGIIDFAPYFLFLEKWYRWTKEHSILSAPGRGSGAGSLLCYLLGITHLNPFTYGLPFERFLSQARLKRSKYPDIDCDFGDREPLLAMLEETYGDKFAQCSTHQTMKIKQALKDACRVILNWNGNDPRLDVITRTIDPTPQGVSDRDFLLGYMDAEGNFHDGHLLSNDTLANFFRDHKPVYEMVLQLLGIPRAVSRHASAYFISDRPIHESSPTCNIGGHICTQYIASANNNYVEKAGLIKFDLLRVNTLSDISSCVRLIQKRMGFKVWEEKQTIAGKEFTFIQGELPITQVPLNHKSEGENLVDIYELPETEEVFLDFDNGKTESMFQVSTSLMTGFARRIKPRRIMDLSDVVALVRPGPLEALVEDNKTTMTEAYIKRRHGLMPVTYAHPDMEPILKDTYGVAVYQEQLQQMFVDLAGYSLEEADYLRETLGKKKKQEMEKALPELRQRLIDRGWTHSQQEVFIGLCISSSAYSFNRAHSASYAVVAYQCAFLKHYFPLEWWTSVLSNAKVEDIKEKGYATAIRDILRLPHVNGPTVGFDLDDEFVHAPIYLIDGIGDAACRSIELARKDGPFKSFQDFFERVEKRAINQGVMHQLIICGAFSYLEAGRSAKSLIEEYHYLKKVTSLKLGTGKAGAALRDAVALYKEMEAKKGNKLDIPELYFDDIDLEVQRIKSLPIYRLNIHEHFRKFLSSRFLYDKTGHATFSGEKGESLPILKNTTEVASFSKISGPRAQCGWVGLVQDTEELKYVDKKTGKQVTALKVYLANDGDLLECVLWPDQYKTMGVPKSNKIVFVSGSVKAARDPGKWSMSIQTLKHL